MHDLNDLKVRKAERRGGVISDDPLADPAADASAAGWTGPKDPSAELSAVVPPGEGGGAPAAASIAATDGGSAIRARWMVKAAGASAAASTKEQMALRFSEATQEALEVRREIMELGGERQALEEKTEQLQEELDSLLAELAGNQMQVDAGVKELEGLIVRRFEDMQRKDMEEHGEVESGAMQGLLGNKAAGIQSDDPSLAGMDPAARRRERKRRLVAEQRKRIETEEAEKRGADDKIRSLQAELARLVEANSRLSLKLMSCEHNTQETREAMEDMDFQIAQNRIQKANLLTMLSGEVRDPTVFPVARAHAHAHRRMCTYPTAHAQTRTRTHARAHTLQLTH